MASLNFGTTVNVGTLANTIGINNTTTTYSFSELRSFSSSFTTSGAISLSSLSNTNASLFKFPPSAIDINASYSTKGTTITNAREGNGPYFTSNSSVLASTLGSYNVFDSVFNNTNSNYYASSLSYRASDGLYTGANNIASFNGESITLQTPNKYMLKKYRIYPTNKTLTAPGIWRVYGSNDNNNWNLLHDQSSRVTAGWTLGSYNEYSIDTSTHGSYKYFTFVTNTLSGNTGGSVNIAELEYYGIPVYNIPVHTVDWNQTSTIYTAGSTSFSVIQSGTAPNVQYQLSQNTTANTEVSVLNQISSALSLQVPLRLQEYKSFTASFEILATNASSHSVNFFVGSSAAPTLTTGNALLTNSGFAVNFNMSNSTINLYNNSNVTVGTQITDTTWKNNVWYPVTVKYQNATSGTWEINANNQFIRYNNTNNTIWSGNTTSSYYWGLQTLTTSNSADSYIRRIQIKTSGEKCFLSPGNYDFIVPSNVTRMSCVCIGAGGGGGLSNGTSGSAYGAGGGGGVTSSTFSVTPNEVIRVVVGAGGVAGTTSSRNGGSGGDSYVMYSGYNGSTKQPNVALTSNTGGTIIASASTETTSAYFAFDGDRGGRTFWSSNTTYNSTNGSYTGSVSTTAGSIGYAGEWLQLQLTSPITLTDFVIFPRGDVLSSATYVVTKTPTSFVLLGSNDGSTWTLVHQESGLAITRPRQYNVITSPSAYSYYRLVAQVVGNSSITSSRDSAHIGEFELNTRYFSFAKGGGGGESNRAGLGGYIISSISDSGAGSGGNGGYSATSAASGGGGAAGYTGNGASGNSVSGSNANGGGSGSGGRVLANLSPSPGSGGGGTGLFGLGTTGTGSSTGGRAGSGGVDGSSGVTATNTPGDGGFCGGGGGSNDDTLGTPSRGATGGNGGVRLYW